MDAPNTQPQDVAFPNIHDKTVMFHHPVTVSSHLQKESCVFPGIP
jgi:hypothetical protein